MWPPLVVYVLWDAPTRGDFFDSFSSHYTHAHLCFWVSLFHMIHGLYFSVIDFKLNRWFEKEKQGDLTLESTPENVINLQIGHFKTNILPDDHNTVENGSIATTRLPVFSRQFQSCSSFAIIFIIWTPNFTIIVQQNNIIWNVKNTFNRMPYSNRISFVDCQLFFNGL